MDATFDSSCYSMNRILEKLWLGEKRFYFFFNPNMQPGVEKAETSNCREEWNDSSF